MGEDEFMSQNMHEGFCFSKGQEHVLLYLNLSHVSHWIELLIKKNKTVTTVMKTKEKKIHSLLSCVPDVYTCVKIK